MIKRKASVNAVRNGYPVIYSSLCRADITELLLDNKANADHLVLKPINDNGQACHTILQEATELALYHQKTPKTFGEIVRVAALLVEKGGAKIEVDIFHQNPSVAQQEALVRVGQRFLALHRQNDKKQEDGKEQTVAAVKDGALSTSASAGDAKSDEKKAKNT